MYSSSGATSKSNLIKSSLYGNINFDVTLRYQSATIHPGKSDLPDSLMVFGGTLIRGESFKILMIA